MNSSSTAWIGDIHLETMYSYCGNAKEVKLFVRYAKQPIISRTPKIRGMLPERYDSNPSGNSQSPQKIPATSNPPPRRLRNNLAKASRCDLSNTDKKSAPRTRTRAAIEFTSFRNAI